jgi:hypothetical protein
MWFSKGRLVIVIFGRAMGLMIKEGKIEFVGFIPQPDDSNYRLPLATYNFLMAFPRKSGHGVKFRSGAFHASLFSSF